MVATEKPNVLPTIPSRVLSLSQKIHFNNFAEAPT